MSAFCCTKTEMALKGRFENAYALSEAPVMQRIERQVCGCDYGGNSWTTRRQADGLLIPALGLDADTNLLDLGAGTGWPGLYLAKNSGCQATLVDLPEIGLTIAAERAKAEDIAERIAIRMADAADLPFEDGSFDAISHSDLLCCLVRKRGVLEECRRVLRKGGRMAFTVISLAPGLSASARERACANAPEFIVAEAGYRNLLAETGWRVTDWVDLTDDYRDTCARQITADEECRDELADTLGAEEARERLESWRSKLWAIEDGLFVREMYQCSAKSDR